MAVSPEAKKEYTKRIQQFKKGIENSDAQIKELEREIHKSESAPAALLRIQQAHLHLSVISYFLTMSDISMQLIGIKNEGFLDQGRKRMYVVIAVLENIVGKYIDVPLNENQEQLKDIESLSDADRLRLIQKIGYSVQAIEDKFGASSKWKWSFVDLYASVIRLMKNMVDYKAVQSKMDPRIEGYNERALLLKYTKEGLRSAANRLREKYEIVSHEPSVMKEAIHFLGALYRIESAFSGGDPESVKRNIEIWNEKLNSDEKVDEAKRKQRK